MTYESPTTQNAALDKVDDRAKKIVAELQGRPVVLIGMMGAGKTSVGKRLALRLGLAFSDADAEIELAAKMSIAEIFSTHGEDYFRDGEKRVLLRMLKGGCRILATGGGAYMNAETRASIEKTGISLWLNADLEVLLQRVRRRSDRPLLQNGDPSATIKSLMQQRYPVYAGAVMTVMSREASHEDVLEEVLKTLERYLKIEEESL